MHSDTMEAGLTVDVSTRGERKPESFDDQIIV